MDQIISNNSRWLWLAALTALAVFAASSGRLLLASGLLLIAVFAFFNSPLAPTPAQVAKPTVLVGLSWGCGFLGVVSIMAAAARSWL